MTLNNNSGLRYDVIVVGGGAAGMMAAAIASDTGQKVILIEKNDRLGKKLMITGKGRCNLTNNCSVDEFMDNVVVNKKFLYGAVNRFSPADTMEFFEKLGVRLKTERGRRVFPCSDRSLDIVNALSDFVKKSGCKTIKAKAKKILVDEKKVIGVMLSNQETIFGKKVILACGGVSYPQTGSDGDGLKMAKMLGHKITKLKPSLVPLVSENSDCKSLQGLSLKNIRIDVIDKSKNKVIYTDFGEMLFTHFGLSGPVILSASTHIDNIEKGYKVNIDIKPALTHEKLDKRLQREFLQNINKSFSNSLSSLLPKKLIPVVIKRSKIDAHCKCNSITKEQRHNLCEILKNFSFDVSGFRPIEEAIITSGGVSVKEINPKTMQSKLIDGLYFAGEMIDVDAYTGGYNLQIAFSTGYLAAIS